jgi:hypothetical protein
MAGSGALRLGEIRHGKARILWYGKVMSGEARHGFDSTAKETPPGAALPNGD